MNSSSFAHWSSLCAPFKKEIIKKKIKMTHYLMKNFASLCLCSQFRNNGRSVGENEELFISAAFVRENKNNNLSITLFLWHIIFIDLTNLLLFSNIAIISLFIFHSIKGATLYLLDCYCPRLSFAQMDMCVIPQKNNDWGVSIYSFFFSRVLDQQELF